MTARASYLQQCSLNGIAVLPTTALLEMAVGCGMLLHDGSSSSVPAVLAAAVAAQLQMQAGQRQLVACEADLSSGAAKLWHSSTGMQQRTRLLTCGFGFVATAASAAALAASQPQGKRHPTLLQLGALPAAPPCSTACLAVPSSDSLASCLPTSLCEAAGALNSSGAQTFVACDAFLSGSSAASRQQPQLLSAQPAAPAASPALQVALTDSSGNSRAAQAHGLVLAPLARAGPQHTALAVTWRRQALGEADCR